MNRKKAFLILQSAACILLAALLIAGAVSIYLDGSARKAENPLADIYTAETAAEKLAAAAPLFFLSAGLIIAGLALGIRDPEEGRPARISGSAKPKAGLKRKGILQAAVVAAAVLLILAGILNGSAWAVLVKAIHVCTECVGLG